MSVDHKPDYVESGGGKLTSFFAKAEKTKALLRVLMEVFQQLEDLNYSVYIGTTYGSSVGAQLDTIGEICHESRDGLSDTEYRRAIASRVKINHISDVNQHEIILELAQLLSNAARIKWVPAYPLGFELRFVMPEGQRLTDNQKTKIKAQILDAVGTTIMVTFIEEPSEPLFTFTSVTAIEANEGNNHGFGTVLDPDAGGRFVQIF